MNPHLLGILKATDYYVEQLRRDTQERKRAPLSMNYLRILLFLLSEVRQDRRVSLGDLASRLGVSTAAITGLIDTLEATLGWVYRSRSFTDRTVINLYLTPRGMDVARKFLAIIEGVE